MILSWFIRPKEQRPPTLSTTIHIMINGKVVGAVQSLNITERSNSDHVDVKAKRVRFDRAQIAEAFNKGFVHVCSQVYPIDFEVKETNNPTVEVHNAWVKSLASSYVHKDYVIVDEMEFEAESVDEKDKPKK